jgi:hypothetical protein
VSARISRWFSTVPAVLLLTGALIAVTPSAASAATCDLRPATPYLTSSGGAIVLVGSGVANCTAAASVELVLREDVSGWFDRTVAGAYGGSGQQVAAWGLCQYSDWRSYFTELRVKSGGHDYKQQSARFSTTAYCA